MNLTIYIDGGARGNPGPAAAGIVLRNGETGQPLHEAGYVLGKATNNVAEYTALVRAIDLAIEHGGKDIQIFSDSELLVKQLTGEYRVKNETLAEILEQAQVRLLRLDSWHIRHVKRAENKRADELVNIALDAGRDVFATGDASVVASSVGGSSSGGGSSDGCSFSVYLRDKPGKACPVRNMPRRFTVGPETPEGVCIHAAQAAFDEDLTLWPEVGRRDAQTHCARCNVTIEIEAV